MERVVGVPIIFISRSLSIPLSFKSFSFSSFFRFLSIFPPFYLGTCLHALFPRVCTPLFPWGITYKIYEDVTPPPIRMFSRYVLNFRGLLPSSINNVYDFKKISKHLQAFTLGLSPFKLGLNYILKNLNPQI